MSKWALKNAIQAAYGVLQLWRHGNDPEAAAEMLRRYWDLGELPIKSMIGLLEAKGVFSLSVDAREVDAFFIWYVTFLLCFSIPRRQQNDAVLMRHMSLAIWLCIVTVLPKGKKLRKKQMPSHRPF
nr:hypothetical protein [Teredinibacter turnerae]